MSVAVVKFRDKEQAIQYANVTRVMPFGPGAMAIEEGNSTLIVPMARITEVILVGDEEEGGEAPEIIVD